MPGCLGGACQRLGVDVLPDLRHLAVLNGDGEDPVIVERPIRGFNFPRSDAGGRGNQREQSLLIAAAQCRT